MVATIRLKSESTFSEYAYTLSFTVINHKNQN